MDSPRLDDRINPPRYWIITFDGTQLRHLRRERGLSQERLSYRARVSLRTIQRVETLSAAGCHIGTLRRIAVALSPKDPAAVISELTKGVSDPATAATPCNPVPRPRAEPWWRQGVPFPVDRTDHARYDAARARELLARTGEFPDSKGGLLMLLTEYRHALYDITSQPADVESAISR